MVYRVCCVLEDLVLVFFFVAFFFFFPWEGRRIALCISLIQITNNPLTVMTFPSNIPFMVILSLIFLLASCSSLSAAHNRWKILYEEHFYLQKWFILVRVLACCILFYPGQFMLFYLGHFILSHTLRSSKKYFKTHSLLLVALVWEKYVMQVFSSSFVIMLIIT